MVSAVNKEVLDRERFSAGLEILFKFYKMVHNIINNFGNKE